MQLTPFLPKSSSKSKSPPPIATGTGLLPHELLTLIFSHLTFLDLVCARLVCRSWATCTTPFFLPYTRNSNNTIDTRPILQTLRHPNLPITDSSVVPCASRRCSSSGYILNNKHPNPVYRLLCIPCYPNPWLAIYPTAYTGVDLTLCVRVAVTARKAYAGLIYGFEAQGFSAAEVGNWQGLRLNPALRELHRTVEMLARDGAYVCPVEKWWSCCVRRKKSWRVMYISLPPTTRAKIEIWCDHTWTYQLYNTWDGRRALSNIAMRKEGELEKSSGVLLGDVVKLVKEMVKQVAREGNAGKLWVMENEGGVEGQERDGEEKEGEKGWRVLRFECDW